MITADVQVDALDYQRVYTRLNNWFFLSALTLQRTIVLTFLYHNADNGFVIVINGAAPVYYNCAGLMSKIEGLDSSTRYWRR
jgi:hypothetical protein